MDPSPLTAPVTPRPPELSAEHLSHPDKHGPAARPDHKHPPTGPSATAVAIGHESSRGTPSAPELTQRITKLWRRLKEAEPDMQESEPAFMFLKEYRSEISPGMSEADRQELGAKLDEWQATNLRH
jgi:hypothetical protein